MENNSRIKYYDILRIILTIFVVIGHSAYYRIVTNLGGMDYISEMQKCGIEDTVVHRLITIVSGWLYTFHMPSFMALSGSLFVCSESKKLSFGQFFQKKFFRLIVPFITVWFFWNFPIKYFVGYYRGISVGAVFMQLLFPGGVYLWFLESLFIVFLISYCLLKFPVCIRNTVIISLYMLGVLWKPYHILGDPFYYLFWFYIGMKMEDIIRFVKRVKLWNYRMFCGAFLLHLFLYVVYIQFCTSSLVLIKMIKMGIGHILLPFVMLMVLYYAAEIVKARNVERIQKISSYCMGIYLYADPLNYLFLYIFKMAYGIEGFGKEHLALVLLAARIFITPLIAVLVTKLIKRMKLKYLY